MAVSFIDGENHRHVASVTFGRMVHGFLMVNQFPPSIKLTCLPDEGFDFTTNRP
jgi:hypothetical protein